MTSRRCGAAIGRRRERRPIGSRPPWNSNGTRSLGSLVVVTPARRCVASRRVARKGRLRTTRTFLKLGTMSLNNRIRNYRIGASPIRTSTREILLAKPLAKRRAFIFFLAVVLSPDSFESLNSYVESRVTFRAPFIISNESKRMFHPMLMYAVFLLVHHFAKRFLFFSGADVRVVGYGKYLNSNLRSIGIFIVNEINFKTLV